MAKKDKVPKLPGKPRRAGEKSKGEERRWRALTTHVVKKKHFTDPADCPQRCLYCANWRHLGGIFGACQVHDKVKQHFRFCDQFEAQVPQLVDIPQVPDPEVIPDDPNNEIP